MEHIKNDKSTTRGLPEFEGCINLWNSFDGWKYKTSV